MFFGRGARRARPAAIDHAGIYLGGNWMIHFSRYGVAPPPSPAGTPTASPGAVVHLQKRAWLD
jgi:cell wall-associated NlpC family hydrolase